MASNLTDQIRSISEVTKAVALGDLGKIVEVDVQEEMLDLKMSVNSMVVQLSMLANEVMRVLVAHNHIVNFLIIEAHSDIFTHIRVFLSRPANDMPLGLTPIYRDNRNRSGWCFGCALSQHVLLGCYVACTFMVFHSCNINCNANSYVPFSRVKVPERSPS